jgi:hypothetical protein
MKTAFIEMNVDTAADKMFIIWLLQNYIWTDKKQFNGGKVNEAKARLMRPLQKHLFRCTQPMVVSL